MPRRFARRSVSEFNVLPREMPKGSQVEAEATREIMVRLAIRERFLAPLVEIRQPEPRHSHVQPAAPPRFGIVEVAGHHQIQIKARQLREADRTIESPQLPKPGKVFRPQNRLHGRRQWLSSRHPVRRFGQLLIEVQLNYPQLPVCPQWSQTSQPSRLCIE